MYKDLHSIYLIPSLFLNVRIYIYRGALFYVWYFCYTIPFLCYRSKRCFFRFILLTQILIVYKTLALYTYLNSQVFLKFVCLASVWSRSGNMRQ
jgi:hypothetical protein